jgi:hypothetical protein
VNICYISHVDISLPNGPGVNEREFLLALREESMLRGDRASCIIPRPSLPLDAPLPDAHFFRPSIPVSRFPSLNRLLANVQLARLIIGLNWRHDYDLHILRLSRTGLFIPVLLRLLGKPYGIKTLGNTKKFNRAGRRPWNERIVTLLFRRILRDSLATDVCTPQLEEYYRSGYGVDNIQVVDNAVNVERFSPWTSTIAERPAAWGNSTGSSGTAAAGQVNGGRGSSWILHPGSWSDTACRNRNHRRGSGSGHPENEGPGPTGCQPASVSWEQYRTRN